MYYEVSLHLLWRTATPERAEDESQPLLNDIAGSYGYTISAFGAKEAPPDLIGEFVEDPVKAEDAHQLVEINYLIDAVDAAAAEDESQPLLNDIAGSYGYTIVGFGAKEADRALVRQLTDTDEEDDDEQ